MPAHIQVLSLVAVHVETADKAEALEKLRLIFSANAKFVCVVLICISSFCKQDSLSNDIKPGNYGQLSHILPV